MIIGIAHVNLTVPPRTLEQAAAFYEGTLGFTRIAVPVLQKDTLAWYFPSSLLFLIEN
jgi:catechol 2,3-dioxygenase-like lactoylglutathione lyase family enzyme